MSKSYRIRTKPGEDDGYLKVNLDLNQNYDFLEILSLKISQKEEYQGFCADYGVIAGRIDINNGYSDRYQRRILYRFSMGFLLYRSIL